LTIELAGEFTLPVECMECKRLGRAQTIYKRIPAGRIVEPGEVSSGYCPEHVHVMEERWFGPRVPA
jgi:hypothetical protein